MSLKVLFVVTEDWYFWSHRLPIARAAQQAGYEVLVAARAGDHADKIRNEGFRLIPWQLSRGSYSPMGGLRAMRQLARIYSDEQPDIVHHVALKPILYGSLVSAFRKDMPVINAFAGLGYLGASPSLKARVLRLAIWQLFRFALNRPRHYVLVQNRDDEDLLVTKLNVDPEKITVIRGSGVDIDLFQPTPEPVARPVVLLASRMLWIKGIQEFVEAARLLWKSSLDARFVLAGDSDPENHSCVPRHQLMEWQASGIVEWWGQQLDMPRIFEQSNVVCLPSHGGEGVPKVLMEAAASGRAIVATDVPGCRDIVRDGVNGLLVQPKNVNALANAVEYLVKNPSRRSQMGIQGRQIVLREFSQDEVSRQTLKLYGRVLASSAPCPAVLRG